MHISAKILAPTAAGRRPGGSGLGAARGAASRQAAVPAVTLPDRQARGQRAIDHWAHGCPRWRPGTASPPTSSAASCCATAAATGPPRPCVRRRGNGPRRCRPPAPAAGAAAACSTAHWRRWTRPSCCTAGRAPSRTIHLNFKGATLTGTAWNGSGNTITAQPFDLDGVPTPSRTTELQRIQYIWQRVAEDYAPFDVNVTTEAVPAEPTGAQRSADTVFGTTVLITK